MQWSYGITSVGSRLGELLPRTVNSLAAAGFTNPIIFADGYQQVDYNCEKVRSKLLRNSPLTIRERNPPLKTLGNWIVSAWELYLLNPNADRYAIFQDDFVTYLNLKEYLERRVYPYHGYLNLFTYPENEYLGRKGWYLSNQLGRGALALVFDNDCLRTLLSCRSFVDQPRAAQKDRRTGCVDGGISDSLKAVGYHEYVHYPSLVQHTGERSTMGNNQPPELRIAPSFRGEDFNAMDLLEPLHVSNIEPSASVRKRNRIGLVGFNCASGIGELNRQIATFGDIDRWLVRPHEKFPTLAPNELVETVVCPNGKKVPDFLDTVDTVVFCEFPAYTNLIDECLARKKRIVCVPMHEWTPKTGWVDFVDLFLCPTMICKAELETHLPASVLSYFPWPVDTERFRYRERRRANKFLYIHGHGGFKNRKGFDVIKQAKLFYPNFQLEIRTQVPIDLRPLLSSATDVLSECDDNTTMYDNCDVLLAPHRVDGIGLEILEAMACGLPVVTTSGLPWGEYLKLESIASERRRETCRREVDWFEPSPKHLAEIIERINHKNILEKSREARTWAEDRSWTKLADQFNQLVKNGVTK